MLRNSGEDADAREVLLAKQRRRRETLPLGGEALGLSSRTGRWPTATGPGRAAVWMAVLWAASALRLRRTPPPPLKGGEAPHWNAALYALDLLLPVIDLGQDSSWKPAAALAVVRPR